MRQRTRLKQFLGTHLTVEKSRNDPDQEISQTGIEPTHERSPGQFFFLHMTFIKGLITLNLYDKLRFSLNICYEGQNHSQAGNAGGGDGTSSLDCLSLIVESISPGAAAVAGFLQGQGRTSVRLHKQEDLTEQVDHTAPVVKMAQQ
ncbi:hypothetical protein ANN_07562 [Periplaneta americana]|uniref:Uncharacterized protein n=1 Tax=Periplaneta americana TaxID=6978 RepID=A0ABQ8SYY6_PERAM|nr:hypothetical protein ANN_07562 [Periplaneta americana]